MQLTIRSSVSVLSLFMLLKISLIRAGSCPHPYATEHCQSDFRNECYDDRDCNQRKICCPNPRCSRQMLCTAVTEAPYIPKCPEDFTTAFPNYLPTCRTDADCECSGGYDCETRYCCDYVNGGVCLPTNTVTEPVTDVVTEYISTTVTQPVTAPVTDPVTEYISKEVTEPVTGYISEEVTETITEPVTGYITRVVTNRRTKPVTKFVKSARYRKGCPVTTDDAVCTQDVPFGCLDERDCSHGEICCSLTPTCTYKQCVVISDTNLIKPAISMYILCVVVVKWTTY